MMVIYNQVNRFIHLSRLLATEYAFGKKKKFA